MLLSYGENPICSMRKANFSQQYLDPRIDEPRHMSLSACFGSRVSRKKQRLDMAKILFICMLLCPCFLGTGFFPRDAVCLAEEDETSPVSYHRVKYVYDGDTVLLDPHQKVRYLGINAPEVDHTREASSFMARDAWRLNRGKVEGMQVRLEFDSERQDRYGRLLAYVFLKNGKMVNALLVRKGLAYVLFHGRNMKYRDLLLGCQREAMEERLGIWSRPVDGKEKFYLGNRTSFRFHAPGCPFGRKISKKNRVRFNTRRAAFWQGYSPCKKCGP